MRKDEAAGRGSEAFRKQVQAFVVSVGGKPAESVLGEAAQLETHAGPLHVEGMDGWVHCRFMDIARANVHFGNTRLLMGRGIVGDPPNPFTGKFNFHGKDGAEAFDRLKQALATGLGLVPRLPHVPHPSHVFRETGLFCTVGGWTRPLGDKPDAPGETCDGCHLWRDDRRTDSECQPNAPWLPKLKTKVGDNAG